MKNKKVQETGELFGKLFTAYDEENYKRSVELFEKRFLNNGFDVSFFKGKTCLDLGCGTGRYALALSELGAKEVFGVDLGKKNIEDAKNRAKFFGIENVHFIQGNADSIDFKDGFFDVVIWSGVLMHMQKPEEGVREVSRILKKGGLLYMLVYATEGIRWPLINILRNVSLNLGFEKFDKLIENSELDVNKRRTYLDDLFVPYIDFYSFERLSNLLTNNNFTNIDRWEKGRLDHEETIEEYHKDLLQLYELFKANEKIENSLNENEKSILQNCAGICKSVVDYVANIIDLKNNQSLTDQEARKLVIGQGHHRLTAIRS